MAIMQVAAVSTLEGSLMQRPPSSPRPADFGDAPDFGDAESITQAFARMPPLSTSYTPPAKRPPRGATGGGSPTPSPVASEASEATTASPEGEPADADGEGAWDGQIAEEAGGAGAAAAAEGESAARAAASATNTPLLSMERAYKNALKTQAVAANELKKLGRENAVLKEKVEELKKALEHEAQQARGGVAGAGRLCSRSDLEAMLIEAKLKNAEDASEILTLRRRVSELLLDKGLSEGTCGVLRLQVLGDIGMETEVVELPLKLQAAVMSSASKRNTGATRGDASWMGTPLSVLRGGVTPSKVAPPSTFETSKILF
eukprot:Tamp_12414.p1 GENE.Tamp_12414~~Tamp_12414.p1  ORF type:complete len:327 (-),score=99.28 Tamp_12414:834-1784(-)